MTQNTETEDTQAAPEQVAMGSFDVRDITEAQLGTLGVSHIAYVKAVIVNGTKGFAIHAASTRLATWPRANLSSLPLPESPMELCYAESVSSARAAARTRW